MLQALLIVVPPLFVFSVLWYLERDPEPDEPAGDDAQANAGRPRRRSGGRRRH